MNQLIIWNNTKYAQTLSNYFGSENIISDKEELETSLKNWNMYSSLIVFVNSSGPSTEPHAKCSTFRESN
ncbi:MAG: hypothetical protein IPP73_10230 [Chitinophagaceae bacterium]|nr:hypothetical protein [Chitinophagaceae bacterium]